MTKKTTATDKEFNADLVVCGGGGAGLAAAVAAAEKGIKRILLLEKRNELGGNTAFSFGF